MACCYSSGHFRLGSGFSYHDLYIFGYKDMVKMSNRQSKTDVILIGAGVMSATLGTLLKELVPNWKITVFEKLADAGEESSNEWNNAGTGHAALCELNYTVEKPDG